VRAPRRTAVALSSTLLLSGCMVGPALGPDSYRGKAQSSVQAVLSEVETARLIAEQFTRGRVPKPYADEVVSASEDAAGWIGDAFGTVQPPRESDPIREEISDLLEEAESLIADVRIATRRGDKSELARLQEDLRRLAERLRAAEERLS
jgi:hypothetical protein